MMKILMFCSLQATRGLEPQPHTCTINMGRKIKSQAIGCNIKEKKVAVKRFLGGWR